LSWGTAFGATSYNVMRATTSGGPYAKLAQGQQVASTAFTDSTASNGTTYYYVVASVNPAGEGALSAEVSATPGSTNQPSFLSMQTSSNGLVLNWSSGTLQSATNVPGSWYDVVGAASPYTNPLVGQQFFRLR
jgi:cellulose 1,4-beta-cellobiosidase